MYIIIYIYICNLRWNVLHMLQDLSACSRSICSKLVPVAGDNTDSWCIFKSLAPSVCETCRTEWLNVTTATTGRGLLISMPWLWPALLTWLWSLAALTITEASSCRTSFTSSMHVEGDTPLHNAATGCCLLCPWHSLQPAAARLGGGVRTRSRVRRRLCGRTPLQTHHDISQPGHGPPFLLGSKSLDMAVLHSHRLTEASSCRSSFTSSMHVDGDTPLHNAATGCCLLCPWHSLQPAAARLGGGVRTRSRVRRRLCGRTPLQTHHDISQPGHGPPFLLGSKSLDMAVLHSHRLTEASSCRSSFTSSMHVDGDTALHNAATGCCLRCPWHSLQPAAARLGGGVRTRSRVRRRLCGRTPLQTHHDISQPGHGPPFLLGSKSLDMAVLHSHRLTEASSCRSSFTSSMHVDGDTALHNAATGCCLRCPWHSLQPAAARLGGGVRTRSRVRRRLCGRTPLQTHHDISQPGHGPHFLLGSKSLDMAVLHSHRLTEASSCRSSFTSFDPCTSTATPRCTMLQRDATVDVCTPPHAFRSVRCRNRICQCCLAIHANEVSCAHRRLRVRVELRGKEWMEIKRTSVNIICSSRFPTWTVIPVTDRSAWLASLQIGFSDVEMTHLHISSIIQLWTTGLYPILSI